MTGDDVPIDIVLHTPGGLVLAAVQIAHALIKHPAKAEELATLLSTGTWTHDHPIMAEDAKEMGLPISTDMSLEVYRLMDFYAQSGQKRPSVSYIPAPYSQPGGSNSSQTES